ncbi:hypothetical protein GCM10010123_07210 [Pilimelia anulata]|uniref:Uncharacterized protein n=1 Tax=Pilimelia anulata TaxID=53371 RepID=A0A8J3B4F5_9ACTN|nr:hypothetical protein [Pilimelia anulata]GGJ79903.1 hypothetical protein GCM10010123_07210 [Pilimelia anulata]
MPGPALTRAPARARRPGTTPAAGWCRAGAALLLLAGLAGCGADDTDARLRLLVRDINIRPVGSECAGTGGYAHLHRRADFRVTDGTGATLATGELPAGVAVPFDEALDIPREPTYCEFSAPVRVPRREVYRLVVPGGPPIPLTSTAGAALVAVVPS